VFLLVAIAAVAAMSLVIDCWCQSSCQRPAVGVPERAWQRAVSECHDAAGHQSYGTTVAATFAEVQSDSNAQILEQSWQFSPGRRIGTNGLDAVHQGECVLNLGLGIHFAIAIWDTRTNLGERFFSVGKFRLEFSQRTPAPPGR